MENQTVVLPFHQRIAELTVTAAKRSLTEDESNEFNFCLKKNITYCWRMAYLVNMGVMNRMDRLVDYQNEDFYLDGGVENV